MFNFVYYSFVTYVIHRNTHIRYLGIIEKVITHYIANFEL